MAGFEQCRHGLAEREIFALHEVGPNLIWKNRADRPGGLILSSRYAACSKA